MVNKNILKHYKGNNPPVSKELAVGEVVIRLGENEAELFTKDFNNNIFSIGSGVTNFLDLQDIDFTNLKEGAFIVRKDNKFVATDKIGSLNSLTDLEIENPSSGEYLRYDPIYQSFRNFKPSYSLYQLLDVDILAGTSTLPTQNNHVLYFDFPTNKFKTRERTNSLSQLIDVDITANDAHRILSLSEDGIWRDTKLEIKYDDNPTLGGNLNLNYFNIVNSTYRIVNLIADIPILEINYNQGDYFIIQGVPVDVNPQCIINIQYTALPDNTTIVLMLEIRQSTSNLFIGGLINVKYEDGKPIELSGNNKTDLITITIQNVNNTITSYITAAALNLASEGLGGELANRYDKYRYTDVQIFDKANLYDNYFKYVQLLLNFEYQFSSGKLWQEDKSFLNNTINTNVTQLATTFYTFGIQEYAAQFLDYSNNIEIQANSSITVESDFTFEFFVNYKDLTDYFSSENVVHTFISNNNIGAAAFNLKYTGSIDTRQNTKLELTIGTNIYTYVNAFTYFLDKESKYIHIALVRKDNEIICFINGIYQQSTSSSINNPITIFNINTANINLKGNLNSVRLTKYARYIDNFNVPNMRFGLTGGYADFLEKIVFDLYSNIGDIYNPIANQILL